MTLADILKRLREATGADREIDDALAKLAGATFMPMSALESDYVVRIGGALINAARAPAPNNSTAYYLPRYTASLDAAIALVEKMLPGANWRIQLRDGDYKASAIISREHPTKHFDVWVDRQGATPALALLIALLEALDKGEPKL